MLHRVSHKVGYHTWKDNNFINHTLTMTGVKKHVKLTIIAWISKEIVVNEGIIIIILFVCVSLAITNKMLHLQFSTFFSVRRSLLGSVPSQALCTLAQEIV